MSSQLHLKRLDKVIATKTLSLNIPLQQITLLRMTIISNHNAPLKHQKSTPLPTINCGRDT